MRDLLATCHVKLVCAVKKYWPTKARLANIAWDSLSIAEIFTIYQHLIETVQESFRAHVQGTMAYAFLWRTDGILRKLPSDMEIYPSILWLVWEQSPRAK